MWKKRLLFGIILLFSVACQPTLVTEAPVPTLMELPTAFPTATLTLTPSVTVTPSPTATPSATITDTPTPTTTDTPTVTPTRTPRPALPSTFIYGKSVEDRDLLAHSFGSGSRLLMLVGGIHTGYEAITVDLVNELVAHFGRNPQDVLPGITLVLVPVANPDGFEKGRNTSGRFNANNVDLNRNWDCDWSPDAVWLERTVDPGSEPFSEPESIALAALIYDLRPDAVMFFHANANGVFAGECEGGMVSEPFAEVIGKVASYPFGEAFTDYVVTGTEASWVDSLSIPAVDVELSTTHVTEFTRNYNAVMAVQRWLLGQ
jgi:predicted deacylase